MKYRLISAALLVGAIILFVSGISASGTYVGALLIVVAVVCEFKFWRRLFHHPTGQ